MAAELSGLSLSDNVEVQEKSDTFLATLGSGFQNEAYFI